MTDNTQPEAREFTMSQYASKDDMIGAMRKRIAELESELEAIGAGGVSGPLMGIAAPPTAQAGWWISVDERLPEPDGPVLAHNGKWTGVAAWMSGEYLEPLERWQDEHREFIEMMGPAITHWMPLPPLPTSAEGVGHG